MKNSLCRALSLVVFAGPLVAGSVLPAAAGDLKLTLANGRATLIAQDVPLRQILAEWARIGKTNIVNGDKLTGPPVTLQLVDRPEREVLEVLLRSASGYIAAQRAGQPGGASRLRERHDPADQPRARRGREQPHRRPSSRARACSSRCRCRSWTTTSRWSTPVNQPGPGMPNLPPGNVPAARSGQRSSRC